MSLGRNDPCWCGSGKKYKKCHLAADEQKEREQKAAIDENLFAVPQSPSRRADSYDSSLWDDAELVTDSLDEEDEEQYDDWYEEQWRRFESADYRGQADIFLEVLESGKMDEEMAYEMLLRVRETVDEDGAEEGRFRELVAKLEIISPHAYRAGAPYFSLWMLEAALARGRRDEVNALLEPLIQDPKGATQVLFDVIDLLMYYEETASLLALMRATSDEVHSSTDLVPEAKARFARIGISLTASRQLNTEDAFDISDPVIRDAISIFLPVKGLESLEALEPEQKTTHAPLTIDNLKKDNHKGASDRVKSNLTLLGVRWSSAVMRENSDLFPRSELARQEILDFQTESLEKGKDGLSLLMPRAKDLDRYLAVLLDPVEPMPHRAAAMVEMLPSYILFLGQQGLLTHAQTQEAISNWRRIQMKTVGVLRALAPELAPTVAGASA